MTDLIPSQFVSPSPRSELNGELGLDLHEIAKSLGAEFKHVKEKYLRMEKDNRIKGVVYTATIDSGTYRERTIESYVLDLDSAKFFVAKWDSEVGDAYTRFLIQCEKKLEKIEVRFDTLLSDPDNAVKVFQELANQKKKAQELEARIPQLESETQTAKRRGFSAMGTAGALTVEADRLRQENERLQLQSSSLLTEIGKLSATHHDFITQLKDTYGVEIEQLKFSNKAFIETLAHVSEQYPWLPKTMKEAKEQLRGDRKLDWGGRGNLYVRWAVAATGKQDITFERLQCECLSRNFITEGDLLRKLKEVADRRGVS